MNCGREQHHSQEQVSDRIQGVLYIFDTVIILREYIYKSIIMVSSVVGTENVQKRTIIQIKKMMK